MDNRAKYHKHITAEQKLLDLNLKEVWKYRDLIVLFTKRTFQLTYKQTVLGPAWIFLNPFMEFRRFYSICAAMQSGRISQQA